MSDSLNNTPGVIEKPAASAPDVHSKKHKSHVVCEWWVLRISAALLVPLSIWLLTSLINQLLGADEIQISIWLASPLNAIALALTLVLTFVHTRIGLHEITLDYLHGAKRCIVNLVIDLLSLGLGIASLAAIWHFYSMA
jgi:succinate dehydrogenase / fumarate reductase membrane anchor subunit